MKILLLLERGYTGTRKHKNQILHARYPRPARLSQRGTGSEEIRHNQGW